MANLELLAITNKQLLVILMVVLIVFIVMMTILAIVFIIALRKRAPVVKVLMAPPQEGEVTEEQEAPAQIEEETAVAEAEIEPEEIPQSEETVLVAGREQRIRYSRSMQAKIAQLSDESKEWYSQIKNELLSYQRVKGRMSWKRESFYIGRTTVARLVVRGKTLCLLLAVDPAGFEGTKYKVENVGDVSSTEDTPCQYRIKSLRKVKYAKEIIASVMKELGIEKNPDYIAEDYFVPYEDTVNLMMRGLVKRVVSDSSQVFEIRKVDEAETAAADATEKTQPDGVAESEKTRKE